MRLPVTLSLVLVAAAALRAEAPPIQGTLPEDYLPGLGPLLKEAVERSPSTINASIGVAQAEASRYQTDSILYPQLSLNANYGDTREQVKGGNASNNKGLYYGAGVSQPLFQWGAYADEARIAHLGEKIAERNFAEAYRMLATLIREQYMGLISKKIAVRNERFRQKIDAESLLAQKAKFESGASSQAELTSFQMALDEQTLAGDRAQEDFDYAKRLLTRLIGIDLDKLSDDSIPLEIPHPEFSASLADAVLAGFVGEGIESTFQNEVYQMYLKQQDLNYSIAKVRLLPKLAATATYSYSNYTAATATYVNQYGLQSEAFNIGATWTIFDGFATRGAKLSALASRRQYERTRQTYVDQTVDTITYLRHQLGYAQRSMSFAETHDALIEVQVKQLTDDKALGYASNATIDAGILNYYATHYLMVNARSDYLGHWSEFISLAGIDPAISNISSRYVR
jgi:outer membrane protein TolC